MFELPEYVTLARQMNETLRGKIVRNGRLGNTPYKFIWYNRSHEVFSQLTKGEVALSPASTWVRAAG